MDMNYDTIVSKQHTCHWPEVGDETNRWLSNLSP